MADSIFKQMGSTIKNALDPKQDSSEKGIANGYAPLDANAKVPLVNLPESIGGGDVSSVAGRTGDITLTKADITDFSEGAGSGLDADLLDGIESSSFARSDVDQIITTTYTFSGSIPQLKFTDINANEADYAFYINTNKFQLLCDTNSDGTYDQDILKLNGVDKTAYIFDNYTIWHSGNDGAGSGLDADTLDGYTSGYFQQKLGDIGGIDLGQNMSGDRHTYLDLLSDDTNTDYSARFIRTAGVNGDLNIVNKGTGNLLIKTNDTTAITVDNTQNVVIAGDLTVSGTTTTVSTEQLNIADNIITLNSNEAGSPTQNAGLEVERGTSPNVQLQWDESANVWRLFDGVNWGVLWHSNNGGSGSGLDADLLDGEDGTTYCRRDRSENVIVDWNFKHITITDLTIQDSQPQLKLKNTDANADDFIIRTHEDRFLVNTDRNDDNNLESPHPLDLNNTTEKGYIYGNELLTINPAGNVDIAGDITAKSITFDADGSEIKWTHGAPLNFVPTGASPSTNSAWVNSVQYYGGAVTQSGQPKYPYFSTFIDASTTTDPTDLAVNLVAHNSGTLPYDIKLITYNNSRVIVSENLYVAGTGTFNSDITVAGTVDGRDIASDGSKLDGIEAGADVTDATNVDSALRGVASVELGFNLTGDRNCYIDLHADDVNADRSARLIRSPGENGDLELSNMGSGAIRLKPNNSENIVLTNNGHTSYKPITIDGTSDDIQLKVQGNATQTSDIFVVENGAGTDLLTVNNSGIVRTNLHIVSGGQIRSGDGTGSASLTTNDGYGNCNITFNHASGIPDITGSSGRISCTVDHSAASMIFQLEDSTTVDVPVTLTDICTMTVANTTISNDLIVSGNLTVNGTTTTVNTETINLADNVIVLNSNETGTPTQNAGIEIERGTDTNVSIQWNETNDKWTLKDASGNWYDMVSTGNLLSQILSVDGAGSNIDADLLDGQHGNVYVRSNQDTTLYSKYIFSNNAEASLAADGAITIGSTTGVNLTFDTNEIQARNNGAASTLTINPAGGPTVIGDKVGIGTSTPEVNLHIKDLEPKVIIESTGVATERNFLTLKNQGPTQIVLSDTLSGVDWKLSNLENKFYITTPTLTGNFSEFVISENGNIGIGTSVPTSRLMIDGAADEVQLLIQGNAIQTANIFVIENSVGGDLFTVNNNGNAVIEGDLAVSGGDLSIGDMALVYYDASINLFSYTEEFDNAVWLKQRSTVSPNVIAAPDGSLTADQLVEDTTTGEHYTEQLKSVGNGETYTYSVFAKATASSRNFWIRFAVAGLGVTNFDVDLGVLVSSTAADAGIESVGDGWYRCWATCNPTTAGNLVNRIQLLDTSSSYTGDGVSGIYLWGAQLEVGSVPTQYRRNRAVDSLVIENSIGEDALLIDVDGNITATGGANFGGNVTVSGTVDGRDLATDGTKLDGIEAGANVTDAANVYVALQGINNVELGAGLTGDRHCYIDFHADDTHTDTSFRIMRNSGVNGAAVINNYGTGGFLFTIDGTSFPLTLAPTYSSFQKRLNVIGYSDDIQLLVRGNSVQTADIFVVENSAGTDLLTVDNSGDVNISNKLHLGTIVSADNDSHTGTTTSAEEIYAYDATVYGSAKLLIQAKDTVSGEINITEALVTHNGTTAYITTYGDLHSGANPLADFTANLSTGNVRVSATGASTNSTEYKVSSTLIKL